VVDPGVERLRRIGGGTFQQRDVLLQPPRKLMAHSPKAHHTKVTLLVDEQAHRRFGALGWDKSQNGTVALRESRFGRYFAVA